MMKFKVCMIGATGVGKTSLVGRFVHSVFSDLYRTTIGVKIETHEVRRGDRVVQLVIWDLSGEDEFQGVQPAYLVGSAGYLIVIDGTRRETAVTAAGLDARLRPMLGSVPCVVVVNKADLVASWDVEPSLLAPFRGCASAIVETSARSGSGVIEAFEQLVDAILARMGT